MSASYHHAPWREIDTADVEQLICLIPSLVEFTNGVHLRSIVQRTPRTPKPMLFFLTASLSMYMHSLFLAEPPESVQRMLRSIGRPDLADTFTELLDAEVGKTTYRRVLDAFRNKFLAHQVPYLSVKKRALRGLEVFDLAQSTDFARIDRRLVHRTAALFRYIRRIYPDLIQEITPSPVDNAPLA